MCTHDITHTHNVCLWFTACCKRKSLHNYKFNPRTPRAFGVDPPLSLSRPWPECQQALVMCTSSSCCSLSSCNKLSCLIMLFQLHSHCSERSFFFNLEGYTRISQASPGMDGQHLMPMISMLYYYYYLFFISGSPNRPKYLYWVP